MFSKAGYSNEPRHVGNLSRRFELWQGPLVMSPENGRLSVVRAEDWIGVTECIGDNAATKENPTCDLS